MVKVSEDSAAKFINALIKSVQTLCHGYLEFSNGIQIIGHINLSVDEGTSLDYILKEKVCKNAENSTLFISNSFHAEPKSEPEVSGKNPVNQRTPENQEESGRVGSAISSISSALTSSREKRKTGTKDSDNLHSHQNSGKRKASDDADHRPPKVTSHHDNSSASQSPYHSQSSPLETKEALRSKLRTASEMDMAESETLLPQTAGISGDSAADIGVNLAGSVLEPVDDQGGDLPGRDDDSDGDLEVTFIKEEFVEGERSACEYGNTGPFIGSHQRASEGMTDPSLYPVSLHSSSTYVPSAHDFQPGPSTSQSGSSSMRGSVSQQLAVQPLPPGTKPACGYVHPSDAQKWMMYELVPGSGVFIHKENYHVVMSKERDGQPDGKAMARYLMSCFWKQSELVGASIAEPPRPHHRSLDKGIINAILDFCHGRSMQPKTDIRKSLWWRIAAANTQARRKQEIYWLQHCANSSTIH